MRTSRDFARVFRAGKRSRSDGITVFVAGSSEEGPSRLGMSIRRAAGNAVARNRTKRRLRAAWQQLEVPDGLDVVVRADRAAVEATYQEMEKHVVGALTSAGALR
ncbi:MAG TPA: ribonuclease P protein component [Actinomycetota bacterium]|nr:ribonuclease P protein component [Actinomycetota bacterium]